MKLLPKVTLMLLVAPTLGYGLIGCASIGPHPQIVTVDEEIKENPSVDKILAAPTSGTGTMKSNDDLNKAVPAAAYARYKDSLIIAESLEKVLSSVHQPKVAPMLLLNWQASFYQWVKDGEAVDPVSAATPKDKKLKRPKKDLILTVAEPSTAAPKNDKDLKVLAKTIKKNLPAYHDIEGTIASGQGQDLIDAVATHKDQLDPIETLLRNLLQSLHISHILLSHLEGDQTTFNKNGPIVLHVALVNVESGTFRYYARSIGRKKEVPANYTNLVGFMAHNMLMDLAQSDHVDSDN
ncbi:MAG: hypothetical protein NTZ90_13045 [Proteobacteria bacterium]|nr:hypothetical protein [Pseudomonadota bacterium]